MSDYLANLFIGCCVSPSSLLWMIITLFIFFIIFAILGFLAIWLLCAYYRRKSRKQIEKELQRRRDDKNQLKLDMFRKKQLELQMLTAVKDTKIGSREPVSFFSREPNPRISSMSYILPPKPGQDSRLLDSRPYESSSAIQPVPLTESNLVENKTIKEIEDLKLLPATTARTPSQKTKKGEKFSTEKKSSQQSGKIKSPPVRHTKTSEKKEKAYQAKPKEKLLKKDGKHKKPEIGTSSMPERYHHQIRADNVHEWISRIGRSTSPVPYFSPNKRVLLIPEASKEELVDQNDVEIEKNNDTLESVENDTSEKLPNSLTHPSAASVPETDVEIPIEMEEENTPTTQMSPISASLNAPPKSTFLDDQFYWRNDSKRKKYSEPKKDSKINGEENTTEKPREKILWNPPDKRAEARLQRILENPSPSSW
ncbi:unnamed protein product [Onchocerca ochengi]|uniref:Uncharacterized protein n=1 Tax=Onchocerca ochengi TaxID=42157 RepID=A0A182E9U5_ONCOC|nr:unnamed protein product [Onchocerca ochengi]